MGAWGHGSMGAWEHGSMGAWEHGSMWSWGMKGWGKGGGSRWRRNVPGHFISRFERASFRCWFNRFLEVERMLWNNGIRAFARRASSSSCG